MKILHVSEILQGGVATYLNEMLPGHAARHPDDALMLLCPQEQLTYLSAALRSAVTIVPYQRTGRNLRSLLRLGAAYRRVLADWQPDLVHAHSSFAGGICRLVRTGTPLIYCPHGWSFDQDGMPLKTRIYASLERLLQHRAQRIIAISNFERDSAIRRGLQASRIAVVRYGLSSDRVIDGERPPAAEGPLQLLFIGRFDRQKGLDWLLDVMQRIPQDRVRLKIMGGAVLGSGRALELPAGVESLGWVPAADIDRHIDAADAVVMPSRWEGFGLVAAEALRRAVPVLVSNRGALPEVVGDAGIVFDLDDPARLARLLLELDRGHLRELGRRGRSRFLEYFTAERMIGETLGLYRQITRKPQR